MLPFSEQTIFQLANVVVDVLLPFYLFYSIATSNLREIITAAPQIVAAGVAIPILGTVLAWVVLKLLRKDFSPSHQNIVLFVVLFANTGFIGFPICHALFGTTGLIYAIFYDLTLTLVTFIVGIWILTGSTSKNSLRVLFNPIMVGSVAGLIWSGLNLPMPELLGAPLEMIGNATLPIALLVAGIQVGIKREKTGQTGFSTIFVAVFRLLIIPLIVFGVFRLIGWNNTIASVIIMQAGMPVAISSTILAKRYQQDATFTATATFWSTLAAMITLPLLALLIQL